MKNRYCFGFIVILIILNVVLLIKVNNYDIRFGKLYKEYYNIKRVLYDNDGNGKRLYSDIYNYYDVVFNKPINNSKYKYILIAVFNTNDCPTCLYNEIKFLNDIFSLNSIPIQSYYIGDENVLKSNKAKFFSLEVTDESKLFNPSLEILSTFICLVDNEKHLLLIHKPEIGNINKSEVFYSRVKRIIN
ncbi:MAG: hypothetical protein KGZ42_11465 [Melioribacter sp.]|nr:hypothetical protein [Melioribacter sp.]